jgi:hypothetical protein
VLELGGQAAQRVAGQAQRCAVEFQVEPRQLRYDQRVVDALEQAVDQGRWRHMAPVHQTGLQLESGLSRGIGKARLVEPTGEQFGLSREARLELGEVGRAEAAPIDILAHGSAPIVCSSETPRI